MRSGRVKLDTTMEPVDRIAMVARWRPVHLGHAPVLRGLSEVGREVLIGIGSSNRYNTRNPFTAAEAEAMIRLVLGEQRNFTVVEVPDLDDGPRWREMVLRLFGSLDVFVSDNPYVASLLGNDYRVIRPVTLVAQADRCPIDGTMVRRAMARGDGWRDLVPASVARLISDGGLDHRFRKEFGLQTLALEAGPLKTMEE